MAEKKIARKRKWIVILLCLFIVSATVLILFPPSSGKMKKAGPGEVSEKTRISVDGADITLFISAKDVTCPVMLVLGGGPGIPQYLMEYLYPTGLDKDFILVYFDYRNAASNYDKKTDISTLTTERYLKDVQGITDYLRERFNQEKIYLMGHSFGTYLGIQTAKNHPEKYLAYIAMGQIVNTSESEKIAYEYMYEMYREQGKKNRLKELDKYPILTDESALDGYFSASIRDKAMHELGVGTTREMKNVISGIFLPSFRVMVYTQGERIKIWQAKFASRDFPVVKDLVEFDAAESITELDIPIYFFAGRYDYTCAYPLQAEYFERITAPRKVFYTFEKSAHSPLYEETELARMILREEVIIAE